jgi:hypothetical protein
LATDFGFPPSTDVFNEATGQKDGYNRNHRLTGCREGQLSMLACSGNARRSSAGRPTTALTEAVFAPGPSGTSTGAPALSSEEFWILDVEGTRLMIVAERSPGSSPGELADQRAILDSIRIEP